VGLGRYYAVGTGEGIMLRGKLLVSLPGPYVFMLFNCFYVV
jgi:hypothetical protein